MLSILQCRKIIFEICDSLIYRENPPIVKDDALFCRTFVESIVLCLDTLLRNPHLFKSAFPETQLSYVLEGVW